MNAPDLCRLASKAFPTLTFTPIDTGRTIEAAHADALACRAEYEPAPTVSAPAQLPLF